jgi:hypothetical protein
VIHSHLTKLVEAHIEPLIERSVCSELNLGANCRCSQHYAGCYRLFCGSGYGVIDLRLSLSWTLAGYPGIIGRLLVRLRLLRGRITGEIDPESQHIQQLL